MRGLFKKKSGIESAFSVDLFLLFVMIFASCGKNNNTSSRTSPGQSGAFDGLLSGSKDVEAQAPSNTVALSWVKPTHETIVQEDLYYWIYASRTNNISSLNDALLNGILISKRSDIDTISIPGFDNFSGYYFTVVVYDNSENPIDSFNSVFITTGVGPTLNSFTISSGLPQASGTAFNSVWSGDWPNVTSFTGDCEYPTFANGSVGTNISLNFGSGGQADTTWTPSTGDASGYLGKCVALCSGSISSGTTLCSNFLLGSGT